MSLTRSRRDDNGVVIVVADQTMNSPSFEMIATIGIVVPIKGIIGIKAARNSTTKAFLSYGVLAPALGRQARYARAGGLP